jgi:hypothetical protein
MRRTFNNSSTYLNGTQNYLDSSAGQPCYGPGLRPRRPNAIAASPPSATSASSSAVGVNAGAGAAGARPHVPTSAGQVALERVSASGVAADAIDTEAGRTLRGGRTRAALGDGGIGRRRGWRLGRRLGGSSATCNGLYANRSPAIKVSIQDARPVPVTRANTTSSPHPTGSGEKGGA